MILTQGPVKSEDYVSPATASEVSQINKTYITGSMDT